MSIFKRKKIIDNPFITELKDENGDSWYHQIVVETQKEEIERLNNIIIEFEKWLKDYIKLFDEPDMFEEQTCEDLKEILDKLQELKHKKIYGSVDSEILYYDELGSVSNE